MNRLSAEREFGTELASVSKVWDFAEDFLEQAGLDEKTQEIHLAIEEWYVNIVKHAFGGKNEGTVKISLAFSDGLLEIVMCDNGPEFDPHTVPPPEKPTNVENIRIGGLGIFFIRSLMDSTEYKRENNWNTFMMKKRFQ